MRSVFCSCFFGRQRRIFDCHLYVSTHLKLAIYNVFWIKPNIFYRISMMSFIKQDWFPWVCVGWTDGRIFRGELEMERSPESQWSGHHITMEIKYGII